MKNNILLTSLVLAAVAFFCVSANAATSIGVGNPMVVVDSTAGNQSANAVTNGLYGGYITGDVNGTGTLTNPIPVDVSSYRDVAVTVYGQGTAVTGATNIMTVYLYASVFGVGTTNATSNGRRGYSMLSSNVPPPCLFDTITLALNSTTAVSTNHVYTGASNPCKGALPFLYVYAIANATNNVSLSLTNYGVAIRGL